MKKYLIYLSFLSPLIFGCSSSTKIVKFPVTDEIYVKPELKDFFKTNPKPSIVLRIPNSKDNITSNKKLDRNLTLLYNTIEKELLKENFNVRDRGLLVELLNNNQSEDYSKIKELINVDLILEVVNIDLSVLYSTNKVTIVKGKKQTETVVKETYKNKGSSAEFKVILVKSNEVAGIYKFNYNHCKNGCEISELKNSGRNKVDKNQIETVE